MRFAVLLFLSLVLGADEDFITKDEYASQLYNNPRGISCAKCHGKEGEGRKIAGYEHKGQKMVLEGPKIQGVPFYRLKEVFGRRIRGMPRYFLTEKEIRALYYFLKKKEKSK